MPGMKNAVPFESDSRAERGPRGSMGCGDADGGDCGGENIGIGDNGGDVGGDIGGE